MRRISLGLVAVGSLVANGAMGAGFEKAVFWSGKHSGTANAAVSVVDGAESLFFNPAGLAGGSGKGDVTLNFSPTWGTYKGPIADTSVTEENEHKFSNIMGHGASFKVLPKLGVGVAMYAVAGSKAIYEGVNLQAYSPAGTPSLNIQDAPTVEGSIKAVETAFGAGYEVIPGLRVGAAYRITKVTASFQSVKQAATGLLLHSAIIGAKKTENGWKAGVQYDSKDGKWGVGASYRTAMAFKAKAELAAHRTITRTTGAVMNRVASDETYLSSSLPKQWTAGGNYKMGDFRVLSDLTYTNYEANKEIGLEGTVTIGAATNLTPVALNWKDQWNWRAGTEYTGINNLALRAGYVLTTQVTNDSDARATLIAPSQTHTLTAGAGTSVMGDKLDLDGSLEYAFAKGDGMPTYTYDNASGARELINGSQSGYENSAFAVHAGLTYKF